MPPLVPISREEDAEVRDRLTSRHREILRRTFLGEQTTEIARAMGLTSAGVRFVQNSDIFRAAIAEMHAEADRSVVNVPERLAIERRLLKAADEGVDVARKILLDDGVNPGIRSKTAFGFLDRAGFGPTRKIERAGDHYRSILERLDEIESAGVEVEATLRVRPARQEGDSPGQEGQDGPVGRSPGPENGG